VETKMIPLDQIKVEQGLNAREAMDPNSLQKLGESIAERGLLQAVVVREDEVDGGFFLVAGHRRLAGCQIAGLTEIPATVRDYEGDDDERLGERHVDSLIENIQRDDINALEEARAYDFLRDSGLTLDGIVQKVAVSRKRVTDRLGLLELGPVAQKLAAKEDLPLGVVPTLKTIAAINTRVSDACAESVAAKHVEPATFKKDPLSVMRRFQASKAYPCFVAGQNYSWEIWQLLPEVQTALNELGTQARWITISFDGHDLDQARAYGVAAFVKEDAGVILDFEWANAKANEKIAKECTRLAKREEEWDLKNAEQKAPRAADGSPITDPDAAKEQRRKEREAANEAKARAIAYNDDLGRELLTKAGKVKLTTDVAIALARQCLDAKGDDYVLTGLRYVHPNFRETEVQELKSGDTKTKITYIDRAESQKKLDEFIGAATSPEEILGRVFIVLLASRLADDRAVAQSKRMGERPPSGALQALDAVAAKVLPEALMERAQDAIANQSSGWYGNPDLDPEAAALVDSDPGSPEDVPDPEE
jgi:ParB/RepB/Spo0J family partition protein